MLLFRVDALETVPTRPDEDEDGGLVPDPPRLQLSAEKVLPWNQDSKQAKVHFQVPKAKFSIQISLNGAYLMDCGDKMLLFIGKVVSSFFCEKVTSSCSRWIDLEIIFLAADVWRLAAELRRRELDGPAWAGKRGQRETAQFCGEFRIFKETTFFKISFSQASLNLRKSHPVPVRIIRDDSKTRTLFTRCVLIEHLLH